MINCIISLIQIIYGLEKVFKEYIFKNKNLIKDDSHLQNKIDEIKYNLKEKIGILTYHSLMHCKHI